MHEQTGGIVKRINKFAVFKILPYKWQTVFAQLTVNSVLFFFCGVKAGLKNVLQNLNDSMSLLNLPYWMHQSNYCRYIKREDLKNTSWTFGCYSLQEVHHLINILHAVSWEICKMELAIHTGKVLTNGFYKNH